MVKNLGVFFAVLLTVLLLSNTHINNSIIAFAQNISTPTNPSNITTVNNTHVTSSSESATKLASEPITAPTKLVGGIKITSPDKGDLVPLNSNKSLVINGVSKDNSTSDCDVTLIINNIKPYQSVQPTGIRGSSDYSTWKYSLSGNYTAIDEGSNKITSKIYCANVGGQPSQAYYSVNVTGSNFTQVQLSNYELTLDSPLNSTNNSTIGGNTTLTTQVQPIAQVQQFNEDTGNGPICCKTTSALTTQGNGISDSSVGSSSSSSNNNNDDDDDDNNDDSASHSSSSNNNNDDDDDNNDDSASHSSSSSNNNNDDDDEHAIDFSSRVNDFGFDFDNGGSDNDNGGSDNDNGGSDNDLGSSNSGIESIFDDVEDSMRSAGIDFSFS